MIELFEKFWEWVFGVAWYWEIPVVIGVVLLIVGVITFLLGLFICLTWDLTWAVLMKPEEMPKQAPDLKLKHDDWWPFLKWVPRRLTAFINGPSKHHWYPVQMWGSNKRKLRSADKWKVVLHPATGLPIIQCDVPDPGTWSFSWPLHFVVLFKNGLLIGFGFRCNYYGFHWNYPRFVFRKN